MNLVPDTPNGTPQQLQPLLSTRADPFARTISQRVLSDRRELAERFARDLLAESAIANLRNQGNPPPPTIYILLYIRETRVRQQTALLSRRIAAHMQTVPLGNLGGRFRWRRRQPPNRQDHRGSD